MVTFKELQEKSTFLKIPAQSYEAGDFLNLLRGFEAHFRVKMFLIKLDKSLPKGKNKKVIGLMKDKLGRKIMTNLLD